MDLVPHEASNRNSSLQDGDVSPVPHVTPTQEDYVITPVSPTPTALANRQEAGREENYLWKPLELRADTNNTHPNAHFIQVIQKLYNNIIEFERAVPSLIAHKLGERNLSHLLDRALESYATYRTDLKFQEVTEQYWSIISSLSPEELQVSFSRPVHRPAFRSSYNLTNLTRALQHPIMSSDPTNPTGTSNPFHNPERHNYPHHDIPRNIPTPLPPTFPHNTSHQVYVKPNSSPSFNYSSPTAVTHPSFPHHLLSPVQSSSSLDYNHQVNSPTKLTTPIRSLNKHAISPNNDNYDEFEESPPVNPNGTSAPTDRRLRTGLKLQGITLATFTGDPIDYPKFFNAFDTHIGRNPSFTDLDKFEMLRNYLSGQPLDTVNNISISPDCYREARRELDLTYHRPVLRMYTLMKRVTQLELENHTPKSIIAYLHKLKILMSEMWSPGSPSSNMSARILILNKIPAQYHDRYLDLESNRSELLPIPELFQALQFTAERIYHKESETETISGQLCPSAQTHVYVAGSNERPSANLNRKPAKTDLCIFCRGKHGSSVCSVHNTPQAKRAVLLSIKPAPCWICLQTNHRSRQCHQQKCSICNQDHASFLCNAYQPYNAERTDKPPPTNLNNQNAAITLTSISASPLKRVLPLAYLSVVSSKGIKKHTTLIDSGSQRSFISESVAQALQLECVQTVKLNIQGIGGIITNRECKLFNVPIRLLSGADLSITCVALPVIAENLYIPKLSRTEVDIILSVYPNSPLPPSGVVSPSILLGVDVIWEFWSGKNPILLPSGLYLLHSSLGPIVSGVESDKRQETNVSVLTGITSEEDISSEETLDDLARKLFSQSIRRTPQGRLSVSFPFLSEPNALTSNNFTVASARLKQLCSKYQYTDRWEIYAQTIEEQLRTGILERVPLEEVDLIPSYYIPHTAVMKPSSTTTKLRVVLDASSHVVNSPSLNDLLLIGPCELPVLRLLHFKFRLAPIAVLADIEKAFHQVEINPEHRNFTKMLWLKQINQPPTKNNLLHLRHTRLPFGVSSSPYLLSASLAHHVTSSNSPLAQEILSSTYVDNLMISRNKEEECQVDLPHISSLFEQIGMNLREFASNVPGTLKNIDDHKISKTHSMSALGLIWNTTDDTLAFQAPSTIPSITRTRRTAMSVIASFYDPLGLLSPIILNLRFLMNEFWPQATLYDLPVEDSKGSAWSQLAMETREVVKNLKIPRSVLSRQDLCSDRLHLEVFADASAAAIGVCLFLSDNMTFSLLAAKSMSSPRGTIPRLELMALLAAMELVQQISKLIQDKVQRITFYSDSSTVLQWMHSANIPQSIFVVNRLKKMEVIHSKLCQQFEIRYCHIEGTHNPADVASRGISPSGFSNISNWWSIGSDRPGSINTEASRLFSAVKHVTTPNTENAAVLINVHDPLKDEQHSTYRSYLRSYKAKIVLLLCLKKRLKHKGNLIDKISQAFPVILDDDSTLEEKAEILAVLEHQTKHRERLDDMSKDLDVVQDQSGCLKLKGRFPRCDDHPYLILADTHFGQLIISHFHSLNSHCGATMTLVRVRRKFWTLPARQPVRKAINNCYPCKRFRTKPFPRPTLKDLPSSRTHGSVYERVGIDEAGPFKVGIHTLHILILTCFITRAIHIEILHDTSALEITLALRRFFTRFRIPKLIYLDNLASHVALKKLFVLKNQRFSFPPPLSKLADLHRISFVFITPLSPWKGGMYERLIGLVKTNLRKMTHNHPITSFATFATLLAEASFLVNSRPLNPLDIEQGTVITPNDFLFPYGIKTFELDSNTEIRTEHEVGIPPKHLLKGWNDTNAHIAKLWQLWSEGYLQALRERNRTSSKSATQQLPKRGMVVLCTEMSKDRRQWHLGIIQDTHVDGTGIIRSVLVRHPDGKTYLRPPESLISLEIFEENDDQSRYPVV